MKKRSIYFMLSGAVALAGIFGLSGCSSNDEMAVDNPRYNSETNSVTAQFVLNVSSAEMQTRQSAVVAQKNANFRGMQDAKLIGLATGKSSYMAPYAGVATSLDGTGTGINAKIYDLGTLYGATAVTNTGTTNSESSSRRVLELTLPLQTDAMLVYARAIPAEGATDAQNGKVNINLTPATNPENITFDLVSRIGNNDMVKRYNETCNLAALILNRILKSEVEGTDARIYTHGGYTNKLALPAISWRGIGATYKAGGSLPPLQENLAVVYNSITSISDDEVRAGSASSVCSMIYSINQRLASVLGATATTDGELNAQRLAEVIKSRVDNYFDVGSTEAATEFRNIGNTTTANTIINGLVTVAKVMTADEYNTTYGDIEHGDLMGFPTSFNIPLGAAQLYFTAFNETATTGGFSYKNPSTSLLDLNSTFKATNYMYPSELLYFNNSSLYVSDTEKTKDQYPNGYNTWDTYSWTSNSWQNGEVTSTTRSVAVKNNINYGVAMLQTKVAIDGTSFVDNRHAVIPSESDQALSLEDIKSLQLTGIIIGGQNHQLGWNYLAKANEATDWDYAIFDNSIVSGTIPTGAGEENYTLVFDNFYGGDAGTQADQKDVLVALEFQNNSERDFYGKGNLVRKGGKFYLIGKLQLGDNRIGTSTGISGSATAWPTKYAIPPYKADGSSKEITRVFIQDYMTTATFKIGANSLKNAFITIPDLRSTQTSLGLSVDLNWREGINFDNIVLGPQSN